MTLVRNVSGEDRYVPALGTVVADDCVVDVADQDVFSGLISQPESWRDDTGQADPDAAANAQAPVLVPDPPPAAPAQPEDTTPNTQEESA